MVESYFHQPALVEEVCSHLVIRPGGCFLDGTVGGGGHAAALLERGGPEASLWAIDRDPDALAFASRRLEAFGGRVHLVRGSYADAPSLLPGVRADGILLDLGLSSHQVDAAERGFSYRNPGPLDMRMGKEGPVTAADLLARLSEAELADLFHRWGEERLSRRIARRVVQARRDRPLTRTEDLVCVLRGAVPRAFEHKSFARIFQALRIAVNDEIGTLEAGLPALWDLLTPGGRMAVISYHSLEDRCVKEFFREKAAACVCPPGQPICTCAGVPAGRILTRRPMRPAPAEVEANPRARSARLRVIEKVGGDQ